MSPFHGLSAVGGATLESARRDRSPMALQRRLRYSVANEQEAERRQWNAS